MRSTSADKKNQDKGSLNFLWVTIATAVSLGISLSILTRAPISNQVIVPYLGLVIIVLGMLLRFVSI